ncbi:hypothetical protein AB0L65_33000 [Nonomuraea sp. NPDC052116]|uniref:hypothetical protein n=1 Tax=Nonomuraea sp. NPDC052116 TaxID=3155665 RepID=UPI0034401CBF
MDEKTSLQPIHDAAKAAAEAYIRQVGGAFADVAAAFQRAGGDALSSLPPETPATEEP